MIKNVPNKMKKLNGKTLHIYLYFITQTQNEHYLG